MSYAVILSAAKDPMQLNETEDTLRITGVGAQNDNVINHQKFLCNLFI